MPTNAALLAQILDWASQVLRVQLMAPDGAVCDLFCGRNLQPSDWTAVNIARYVGIDFSPSALQDAREEWEAAGRPFEAEFVELDPCLEPLRSIGSETFDAACCLGKVQDSCVSEKTLLQFLENVSHLLKPGGFFFGLLPDSATIWHKYQKAAEVTSKSASRLSTSGTVVRTPFFSLAFEEPAPFDSRRDTGVFGIRYVLRFLDDDGLPAQSNLLLHMPTFIRLAHEVGLDFIEIQNLQTFFEENRTEFWPQLQQRCPSVADQRTPVARELLGLHAAFSFRKRERSHESILAECLRFLPSPVEERDEEGERDRGDEGEEGGEAGMEDGMDMGVQEMDIVGTVAEHVVEPDSKRIDERTQQDRDQDREQDREQEKEDGDQEKTERERHRDVRQKDVRQGDYPREDNRRRAGKREVQGEPLRIRQMQEVTKMDEDAEHNRKERNRGKREEGKDPNNQKSAGGRSKLENESYGHEVPSPKASNGNDGWKREEVNEEIDGQATDSRTQEGSEVALSIEEDPPKSMRDNGRIITYSLKRNRRKQQEKKP